MNSNSQLRRCLRAPIPEIEGAANLLEQAVMAHFAGKHEEVVYLLHEANMPAIREWTESLWGKNSAYAPTGPYWSEIPNKAEISSRMPSKSVQQALVVRDGHYCRFCGIQLVRKEVRVRLNTLYPNAHLWGRSNSEQHSALQCMWLQYDHIIPHSRGGSSDISNMLITCAPCNYGRMQYTLEEAQLENPLLHAPRIGPWRGLELINSSK
ncbi:HNH endonuclease [uncultured Thiodictyon sp.]|jgi:5-methylcytosine-specific restriction endonuclease McrA|uniref:HNH endonuclease n=1 Tax=uncultured Thiodictyon sp. TaxID=1846217 RepID=UPI0025DA1413|nr:HNH endonuclease [uncultured Thiodictyon sp.]